MNLRQDYLSINYSPKGMSKVLGIVVHSTWGTYAGSISWFKNSAARASAHYIISAGGEITHLVDEAKGDMSWHAGIFDVGKPPAFMLPNPNACSVGIELEDKRDANYNYPAAEYNSLLELINLLCSRYGIPKDTTHIVMQKKLNHRRRSDPVGNFNYEGIFSGGGGESMITDADNEYGRWNKLFP